ncbi:hypothetical protein [Arenivirga flava]|uniref:hypothetical protein n=1 Tax=Arenivirga flava TaxID=1930060 RepID=UPI0024E0FDA1|nr:hypothetical protein [Arenivirga flava]
MADTPAVAYEAVVAKLSAEHPELSVVEVEAMVQSENEAHLGGAPLVVPEEVVSNVEELIEERDQADT